LIPIFINLDWDYFVLFHHSSFIIHHFIFLPFWSFGFVWNTTISDFVLSLEWHIPAGLKCGLDFLKKNVYNISRYIKE